jgi:hypothetical protein
MVIHKSKDVPLQIYHWIPESQYTPKPARKNNKHPAIRAQVENRRLVGVPLEYFFPEKGANNLSLRIDDGAVPFLQFLRALPDHPGHSVTFFKGELKQIDFPPTGLAPMKTEVVVQTVVEPVSQPQRIPAAVSVEPEESDEDNRRGRPLKIPRGIQLFYKLPAADRTYLLDRMPIKQRSALEKMTYEDEQGVHRTAPSEVSGNGGTMFSQLESAAGYILQRIDVSEDGQTVTRRQTEEEHFRSAFGIRGGAPASDQSAMQSLVDSFNQPKTSKKDKRRKKGWSRQ